MPKIAKIAVEISLNREFDYLIPAALAGRVQLGSRVLAPFGRSVVQGYVVGLAESSERTDLKPLQSLADEQPLLSATMLKLARWLADYYAATLEQALRTVLPCAVRRRDAGFREERVAAPTAAARDPAVRERLRRRAPAQAAALERLLRDGPLAATELAAAGAGAAALRALAEKKLVLLSAGVRRRDPFAAQVVLPTAPLTLFPEQAAALDLIRTAIDTLAPPVVLLHGVTGSGKTEVYLQAIRHALDRGRGAIVLVPEISLTPQTVERFRGRFGDDIAVLHSHLSDGERHDEWHRLHAGRARIAIGARSALFAPVAGLGLIVVDEEHEPSYKQSEVPRYHARDVAVMRGRLEGCAVVLGSASPALESFDNSRRGKYRLARLSSRVDHRRMPVMRIVDLRVEAERVGHVSILSRELAAAIQGRLEQAEQTMLFLNRRGFATTVLCPACGFVAVCEQCSVKMTYHKSGETLRCHLCGRAARVPERCPGCGVRTIKFSGIGTQRVEAVVRSFFPKARVARMDADTTTRKLAYHEILGDFQAHKIDILIGTQMIAKGLHFPGVTLVGVICADLSLQLPDFRAGERTLQLLLQVSGRAGRGDIVGEVIVQTFTPAHPAIQAARRLDYEGFMDQELEFRRELEYPPCARLACLTLEGAADEAVRGAGEDLARRLRAQPAAGLRLAGPAPAPFSRVKGQFRHQLILRSPSARAILAPLKAVLCDWKPPRGVRLSVDMDAIAML